MTFQAGVLGVSFIVALVVSAGLLYGLKWVRGGGVHRVVNDLAILFYRWRRHREYRH